MATLIEELTQQLGGQALGQIASQIGGNQEQTGAAVSAALPVLVSALARNASSPGGAEALAGALSRDHDGSILDNLGGLLGGQVSGRGADGGGILGHMLGGQPGRVESAVSKTSGLDMASVTRLLPILAPMVLGMLGKKQKQGGLDVGGLASMLGGEREQIERQAPGMAGMVGQLLDADGDGSVADDLLKMGGGLLGGFLGKK